MTKTNLNNQVKIYKDQGLTPIPFHIEDCCGGITKEPRGKGWNSVTLDNCEEFFTRLVKSQYKPVNAIGILTGKESNLTVVDYDMYKEDDKLDRKVFENLFFDKTRTVKTMNGGFHFYFKYDKDLKQTQGKGCIDIRNDGGCVVSPPSTYKDGKYEVSSDIDINELNEEQSKFLNTFLYPKKVICNNFPEPTKHYDIIKLCLQCLDASTVYLQEKKDWENVVKAVKKHLGDAGLALILEWSKSSPLYNGDEWIIKSYNKATLFGPLNIDWLKKQAKLSKPNQYYCTIDNNSFSIDRMLDLVEPSEYPYETAVKYFNKFHYKVKGNQIQYASIEPEKVYVWTKQNLKDMYSHGKFEYLKDGAPAKINVVDAWLGHKYQHIANGITFKPDFRKTDTIVNGEVNIFRGGLHKYDQNHIVNMDLCSPWLNHLKNIWCQGEEELYDFTIGRLAIMFQKPTIRIPISIAVKGDMGCGKSSFVEFLGSNVLGDHLYAYFDSMDDYLGSFNSNQEQNLLNFLDEINSGGSAWKQSDRLKSMGARKKKTINHKYGSRYDVVDYSNTIYATNHWSILKIEQGDRRYFMLECSNEKLGDSQYFDWLYSFNTIESGYEMFHFLMNWDLSNWQREKPPATRWKQMSMMPNITPAMFVIISWLHLNRLEDWEGESLEEVIMDTDNLWQTFVDRYGHLQHKSNVTKGRFLSELRDIIGVTASGVKKIEGKTVRIYEVSYEEVYEKVCTRLRLENLDEILSTYEDWQERAGDSYMKNNCLI